MDDSHGMQEQLEQFLYTGNDARVEDLTRYKRHGFHPVILGHVLPKPGTSVGDLDRVSRYRILLKLGFGAFATVGPLGTLLTSRAIQMSKRFDELITFTDDMSRSKIVLAWALQNLAMKRLFCPSFTKLGKEKPATKELSNSLTCLPSRDRTDFTNVWRPKSYLH